MFISVAAGRHPVGFLHGGQVQNQHLRSYCLDSILKRFPDVDFGNVAAGRHLVRYGLSSQGCTSATIQGGLYYMHRSSPRVLRALKCCWLRLWVVETHLVLYSQAIHVMMTSHDGIRLTGDNFQ